MKGWIIHDDVGDLRNGRKGADCGVNSGSCYSRECTAGSRGLQQPYHGCARPYDNRHLQIGEAGLVCRISGPRIGCGAPVLATTM